MTRRVAAVLLVVGALAVEGWPIAAAPRYAPALKFDAASTQKSLEYALGRDLVVRVRRAVDAQSRHMGWDLTATDRRLPESPNFLYECLCGHGPRAFDLYAWHFQSPQPFDGPNRPTDRILPIYGYPFELRVVFGDVRVEGGSEDVRFVSGTIGVEWRRLAESNPRQRRLR